MIVEQIRNRYSFFLSYINQKVADNLDSDEDDEDFEVNDKEDDSDDGSISDEEESQTRTTYPAKL